jgi:hypothetical protein
MTDSPMVPVAGEVLEPEKPKTPKQWARIIRNDVKRLREDVLRLGQHLIEARYDVGPGNFEDWVQRSDLGISLSSASKFMAIAAHPTISQALSTSKVFPQSYEALYSLTQLPPSTLQLAIEAGDVRPDMTTKDAQTLVRHYKGGGRPPPRALPRPTGINDGLDTLLELTGTDPKGLALFIRWAREDDRDRIRSWLEALTVALAEGDS